MSLSNKPKQRTQLGQNERRLVAPFSASLALDWTLAANPADRVEVKMCFLRQMWNVRVVLPNVLCILIYCSCVFLRLFRLGYHRISIPSGNLTYYGKSPVFMGKLRSFRVGHFA